MSDNVLTGLIQQVIEAADIAANGMTGFIPSVYLNSAAEGVAVNQPITYPIVDEGGEAEDVVAAATGPDPSATTDSTGTMQITKSKAFTFYVTAEERKSLSDETYRILMRDRFAARMRKLRDLIEADLAAQYIYASRAYGSAGAAMFQTAADFTDGSFVRKILADNGAPMDDISFVINSASGAYFRGKQAAATTNPNMSLQEQGILHNVGGMVIRESALVATHTAGTGSAYDVNQPVTAPAIGDMQVEFDTGSGTVLAGDIIVNAESGRDANKYVVATALTGGHLHIQSPGLLKAWNDGDTITLTANYSAQLAFPRAAIHLLARVPAMPEGGDSADDVTVQADSRGILNYQIAAYRQRRRVAYEVSCAWGVKTVLPKFLAIGIA